MKKLLLLLLFSCLWSDAIDYAVLSVHSRAESLGHAVVARANGIGGVYFNPAQLAISRNIEFTSSTGKIFEDYTRMSVGLNKRLDDMRTYVGVAYTGAEISEIPSIEKVGDRPQIMYQTKDVRSVYMTAAAYQLDERTVVGTTLKYYNHQLFTESATALAFDSGATYRLTPWCTLGGALRNWNNPKMSWSTGHSDSLERETQIGVAFEQAMFFRTILSIDRIDRSLHPVTAVGLETWLLDNVLAIRCGKQDYWNIGCGLTVDSLTIDYAYMDHEDLGTSHRISMGAVW
jgi:hypothetical protein